MLTAGFAALHQRARQHQPPGVWPVKPGDFFAKWRESA